MDLLTIRGAVKGQWSCRQRYFATRKARTGSLESVKCYLAYQRQGSRQHQDPGRKSPVTGKKPNRQTHRPCAPRLPSVPIFVGGGIAWGARRVTIPTICQRNTVASPCLALSARKAEQR